jgi:hypothetical protein
VVRQVYHVVTTTSPSPPPPHGNLRNCILHVHSPSIHLKTRRITGAQPACWGPGDGRRPSARRSCSGG